MILEYYTDAAGFHRYIWQQPSGAVYHFKLKATADDAQLAALAALRDDQEQYQNEQPAIAPANDQRRYFVELVELIKERPTLTAAQFNTYLGGRLWFEEVELRHIVFIIARALADRKEVQIAGSTEAQAFLAVRNFIRDTPVRRLAKIFLNQLDL